MPKTLGASQVIKLPTCICNWICSLYLNLYLWLYSYLYLVSAAISVSVSAYAVYLFAAVKHLVVELYANWQLLSIWSHKLVLLTIRSMKDLATIATSLKSFFLPSSTLCYCCWGKKKNKQPDEFPGSFRCWPWKFNESQRLYGASFYWKPVSGINSDRIFLIFSLHLPGTFPGHSFNVVAYVAEIVADSFDFYSLFMRKYLSSCGCHLKIQFDVVFWIFFIKENITLRTKKVYYLILIYIFSVLIFLGKWNINLSRNHNKVTT